MVDSTLLLTGLAPGFVENGQCGEGKTSISAPVQMDRALRGTLHTGWKRVCLPQRRTLQDRFALECCGQRNSSWPWELCASRTSVLQACIPATCMYSTGLSKVPFLFGLKSSFSCASSSSSDTMTCRRRMLMEIGHSGNTTRQHPKHTT